MLRSGAFSPTFASACLIVVLSPGLAGAQSQLSLGHVNVPVERVTCPPGVGPGSSCYGSTVSCPNTLDIGFTYAVVNPHGADGTVVFFNGGDGTTMGFATYVAAYTSPPQNFQTVQVAWASPWEDTGNGIGTSLKDAACRPATLMDWLLNQKNVYKGGGMCAQGASGGSAAVVYSLVQYGASRYLNHVALMSGPVMSDLSIGCNPRSPEVTVCPGSQCLTGGEGGWPDSPIYVGGDEDLISTWSAASGENACVAGNRIAEAQYDAWKTMSIVDGLTGRQDDSTFSYPHTSIAGWLCSKPPGCGSSSCQNNTAAQGQFFYENVTTPVSVYRVDACEGPEGVGEGTVPELGQQTGVQAIASDMIAHCTANQ